MYNNLLSICGQTLTNITQIDKQYIYIRIYHIQYTYISISIHYTYIHIYIYILYMHMVCIYIYVYFMYIYIYMYVYIVYLNRPSRHIVATKVGFFSQVCCEAKFEKGYKGPSLNKVCVPWTQRRWWGKMVVLYGFIRDRIVGNNGGLIMQ